jgi:phosphotransferase system HPr (HPr) family protein
MVSQTVVFQCDEALQMKAVAVLIQKASSYRSSIYLSRSGRRANAKSLLGVMSLGIENSAEIEVTADGEDQQDALKALVSYLENPSAV